MVAKLYAGSRSRPAENIVLSDKIRLLRIIYSLSFFPNSIKIPWDNAPSLVPFLAHLSQMKDIVFVCRYVEPFRSYALPIDGGSAKFEFFPAKFLGMG